MKTQKNYDELVKMPHNDDPIFLCTQFFIHNDESRQKEILFCLKHNIKLGLFKQIILLNERIYTNEELGLTNKEMKYILQINIEKRLTYSIAFKKIQDLNLKGYCVLSNSDIFFEHSILNLRKSCLNKKKSIYALLRFEYIPSKKEQQSDLFFPEKSKIIHRNYSQDVWIYHSNFSPTSEEILKDCNFNFGLPGCDNKIAYILENNGYTCINEPFNVKTYHYHMQKTRNYLTKTKKNISIPSPYLLIDPIMR